MTGNTNLHRAKKAKNDEFYTQLNDIAKEMNHYRKSFSGKIIYCNADDPTWSAFWEYFHLNFEFLGLKKLISTHYNPNGTSYKKEYTGGNDADITIGEETPLSGNGDFRNEENIEILKTADIVVTNPPFSKSLDYISQLNEFGKDFLIMGNVNMGVGKVMFPAIKQGKCSTGYAYNKTLEFVVPDTYNLTGKGYIGDDGRKRAFVPSIAWYTTLDAPKPFLPLTKTYNPTDYPKLDNFDAININRIKDIPSDYYDVMAVPITFLGYYNPNQFELIGQTIDVNGDGRTSIKFTLNGRVLYRRVLIKRKTRK